MLLFIFGLFLILIILGGLRCQLAAGEGRGARAGGFAAWMALCGSAGAGAAALAAALLALAAGRPDQLDAALYTGLLFGGLGGMELGFVVASRRQSRLR